MPQMWIIVLTLAAASYAAASLPLAIRLGDSEISLHEDGEEFSIKLQRDASTTSLNILSIPRAGLTRGTPTLASDCGANAFCIQWNDATRTTVTRADDNTYVVSWEGQNDNSEFRDCFKLEDNVQWFGGPETKLQYWPVQHMQFEDYSYIPKEDDAVAIAEAYWLSSTGTFIFVDKSVPLFIDQNIYKYKYLCLLAKYDEPYRARGYVHLNYTVGIFDDPRTAHEYAIENFLGKPTGIPDELMITRPVWSSWARYKVNVSDTVIREYTSEILAYNFTNSHVEIDDFWEICYGSLTFNTSNAKFPDMMSLTDYLNGIGFRVSLWVHPFINTDCEAYYNEALSSGYFARNEEGSVETKWWQGENASVIDFTNPDAVEWFVTRLWALKNSTGIDSFKFDAGETSWVPQTPALTGRLEYQPGIYTSDFVEALSQFGGMIEIRTGWGTQNLPNFVRMLDKDTLWTWNNGLPTLITTLLAMNMAGYIFVLPDMVGGNGYVDGVVDSVEYPEKELFIRWLQANTFMPAIQYSFVPWLYDDETIEICRKYTLLHEEYAPTIINLMKESLSTGAPLNAPIWWIDPTNAEAHKIGDEYLLGETILIAPVIEEGAVTRDIYLPSGIWREEAYADQTNYVGPTWIYDYPAPLDVLPYFTKISDTSSASRTISQTAISLLITLGIITFMQLRI